MDGVEYQRTLARARQTGHHRQPLPRDIHADVLEIVLPGPDDPNDPTLIHPKSPPGPAPCAPWSILPIT